jgi:excisionase family DNA binding protein
LTKEYFNEGHEYLTANEAADLLRVSAKLIRDMARQGLIPGRKIGREWRFSRAALQKWLEEQEQ